MIKYFLLAAIIISDAANGEQKLGASIDYDVNIRLKGSFSCGKCSADSVAEVYLSRSDAGSGEKILEKYYLSTNDNFNVVRNYSWGKRSGVDEKEDGDGISVFISIAGCGKIDFRFYLSKLVFIDNEFIIDLGKIYMKCSIG